MPFAMSTKPYCIILPTSTWKLVWDLFVLILLLFVSVIVPFRLAYYPTDDDNWVLTYAIVDSFFFIDIVLTFFSATLHVKTNVV